MSSKLAALDERVLHFSRKQQELRTPEGWRRHAERWRGFLWVAAVLLILIVFEAYLTPSAALGLVPLFGVVCLRVGQLKGEADRLNGRGFFENNRPPGL